MYILIIILLFILMVAVEGNVAIAVGIIGNNASYMEGRELEIFVAIIVDLILPGVLIRKVKDPVISYFRTMKNGLERRRKTPKEPGKLQELLSEEPDVERLEALRRESICESSTKRVLRFCQLMEALAGGEQMQGCMSAVKEKQGVLDEIAAAEKKLLEIAEGYKNVGNAGKCRYYLSLIQSDKLMPEALALENECQEMLSWDEKERKVHRLCRRVLVCAIALGAAAALIFYVENTPYRNLRSMIRDQSLTAEMCQAGNRNSKESCYDYITSERGLKLLASELSRLHKKDDIHGALWLLCTQPDCIDGIHLCASPSFIEWIVGYAKSNGDRSDDQDSFGKRWYNVTYLVDGYEIILDSYNDSEAYLWNISDFIIICGETRVEVHGRKSQKQDVPVIR